MTTAVATAVELLRFPAELPRTRQMFEALRAAAPTSGVALTVTETYRGAAPWLLLWGPGAPARMDVMRRHCAGGGHVLAFDLAYWDRHRKVRVSIDTAHPQAWVMRRTRPRDRFFADAVRVTNTWQPTGPIVVAGIGAKARVQYDRHGDTVLAWETAMVAACRSRWPTRTITYRPKQLDGPRPPGVQVLTSGPIDPVVSGASLVITWHSNVAVDAIRLGIPVVCRDGAAAAVCPSELPEDPRPLPVALRDRFLGNLAWFQWAPSEATACWAFLQDVLP